MLIMRGVRWDESYRAPTPKFPCFLLGNVALLMIISYGMMVVKFTGEAVELFYPAAEIPSPENGFMELSF